MESNEITSAYQQLAEATRAFAKDGEKVIELKTNLDAKIAMAYAEGTVQGKNQNERDGWVAQNFQYETSSLEAAQAEERKSKLQLDLARIEVEKVRALLRLMELTQAQ